MLNRLVVKELIDSKLEDAYITMPSNIDKKDLVEAFCQYIEDDYYEWLNDNFKSFFNHYNPDWTWIREKINYYVKK